MSALVGQNPYDMGYRAIYTLDALSRGEKTASVIPTEIKTLRPPKSESDLQN